MQAQTIPALVSTADHISAGATRYAKSAVSSKESVKVGTRPPAVMINMVFCRTLIRITSTIITKSHIANDKTRIIFCFRGSCVPVRMGIGSIRMTMSVATFVGEAAK